MNLDPIKQRLEKITPGEWEVRYGGVVHSPLVRVLAGTRVLFYREQYDAQDISNLEFAAHAPTDQRAMVDEIEHVRYWYGTRFKRLGDFARNELTKEQQERFFSIVANGTADVMEDPEYARHINMQKHQIDTLKATVERLETLAAGFNDAATLSSHLIPAGTRAGRKNDESRNAYAAYLKEKQAK